MKNINLGQERRGAYAIYTTWGCAGSEENGLADVSEKLWTFLSDIVLQVLSFVAENERTKKMMLKQAAEACNMPVGTFYDKARKFENITKIKRINNWGKCTFAKVEKKWNFVLE